MDECFRELNEGRHLSDDRYYNLLMKLAELERCTNQQVEESVHSLT